MYRVGPLWMGDYIMGFGKTVTPQIIQKKGKYVTFL